MTNSSNQPPNQPPGQPSSQKDTPETPASPDSPELSPESSKDTAPLTDPPETKSSSLDSIPDLTETYSEKGEDKEAFEELDTPPPTQFKKIMHILGWVGAALFFLLFFTWMKLPDDKIKNYISGRLNAELASEGISFTAAESELSFLLGTSYVLKNVTLNFAPPTPSVKLERLEFSPSILSFLIGKMGGEIKIQNGEGRLRGAFSFRGSKGSVRFKADKMEIEKLGVIPMLIGIQLAGLIDGEASLEGDMNIPNTVEGSIHIFLKKVDMPPQSIAGFSTPKVFISEGEFETQLEKGKALIKTLKLGKTGTADDLQATLTGDLTLSKTWQSCTLNTKAKFSVSENVTKSFVLLDAILGPGKQTDGSYNYALTGPFDGLVPTPLGTGN